MKRVIKYLRGMQSVVRHCVNVSLTLLGRTHVQAVALGDKRVSVVGVAALGVEGQTAV